MKLAISFLLAALALPAAATVSDISLEVVGPNSYFLPPGANVDLEVVIRNHGPDDAASVIFQTNEYLISPIGEVLVDPGRTGIPCPLQYTDFVTPSGQTLEITGFTVPGSGARLAVGE